MFGESILAWKHVARVFAPALIQYFFLRISLTPQYKYTKYFEEFIAVRIHAAHIFAAGQKQENPGELLTSVPFTADHCVDVSLTQEDVLFPL